MLVLKLEQNLFQELGRLPSVNERTEGDSVFRTMDVDFYEGISNVTVEKRKYPFFYKYYLYFNGNLSENVELRQEEGARFLIAFYSKFCPSYVKNPVYNVETGMDPEEYFHMDLIEGEAMQHFVPGKGLVEELEGPEKKDNQGYRALEGYHEFSEEEKQDVGGQLDALKNQFADQLKELEALMGKKAD